MEMDLGTTIVWVILLMIVVIPFVIMYRNRLSKEKELLLSLQSVAGENGSNIHQHELCSDFAIGIDEQKNRVFFIKRQNEGGFSNYIDLSTIKACQSVKSTRTVVNNSEPVVITERVTLNFSPKQPGKNDLVIELYNEASHAQLNGELQFADKWSKLISSRL